MPLSDGLALGSIIPLPLGLALCSIIPLSLGVDGAVDGLAPGVQAASTSVSTVIPSASRRRIWLISSIVGLLVTDSGRVQPRVRG
jgi:hypothetical protein